MRWNIFRSPLGDYCDELKNPAEAYGPAVLRKIREDGFNAIWLRVVLRECVPTSVFPELQPEEGALSRLREIVTRCAQEDLAVFAYLNEPLGFPEDDAFWKSHPHLRGHLDRSFDDGWPRANALCSSQAETRDFLEVAVRGLFEGAPGLAGVILITASEHLTHCYSHESRYARTGKPYSLGCSRCSARNPAEIVGEIVTAISKGARLARPDAEVIVWNWSWSYFEPAPHRELLSALPEGVKVMIDFERGGTQSLNLENREVVIGVDEYSLGYPGPSPAFVKVAEEAARRGFEVMAKLQIGTTHEMATVPNLPLIPNLVKKIFHLRAISAAGFTATWCLGTFPSLNTHSVGWLCRHPEISNEADALKGIARSYFPGCDADRVILAWERYCQAFTHYPQLQDFLYVGPVNAAPAYPWTFSDEPMRPSWFPPETYGSQFSRCFGPLSLEDMIFTLREFLRVWNEGIELYASGLSECQSPHASVELGVAQAIFHQIQSVVNLFAYYKAIEEGDEAGQRDLLQGEADQLKKLVALIQRDSRLGFHQGCFPRPQFFYDIPGIEKKLLELSNLQKISTAREMVD